MFASPALAENPESEAPPTRTAEPKPRSTVERDAEPASDPAAEPVAEQPVPRRRARRVERLERERYAAGRRSRKASVDLPLIHVKGRSLRPQAETLISRVEVAFEVGTARYAYDPKTRSRGRRAFAPRN
jgi:hypothetical protein